MPLTGPLQAVQGVVEKRQRRKRVKKGRAAAVVQLDKDEATRVGNTRRADQVGSTPAGARDRDKLRKAVLRTVKGRKTALEKLLYRDRSDSLEARESASDSSDSESESEGGAVSSHHAGSAAFEKLYGTYVDWEQGAQTGDLFDPAQEMLLQDVQDQIRSWINRAGRGSSSQLTRDRHDLLHATSTALSKVEAKVASARSDELYLAAMTAGYTPISDAVAPSPVEGGHEHAYGAALSIDKEQATHGLQQYATAAGAGPVDATKAAKTAARLATQHKHGLTTAEVAAIYTYTDANYKYMNPAASGKSKSTEAWLDGQKTAQVNWSAMGNDTLRHEGAEQTAVALRGLRKLPRYKDVVYRGQGLPDAAYQALGLTTGGVWRPAHLMSTSLKSDIAGVFAQEAKKDYVVLLWTLKGVGRDIAALSHFGGEAEVLVAPGDPIKITSMEVIDASSVPGAGDSPVRTDAIKLVADQANVKKRLRFVVLEGTAG